MTLKSAGSRAMLIEELALDVARYRMSDTTCLLPPDRIVTDADRRFVLCLLRQAAPLYPLPTGDPIGASNYLLGRAIEIDESGEENVARYADNGELADFNKPRPCKVCGEERTPLGHDPCIANLPGVNFACCGHGVEQGYVAFKSGHVIRGTFEIVEQGARCLSLIPQEKREGAVLREDHIKAGIAIRPRAHGGGDA